MYFFFFWRDEHIAVFCNVRRCSVVCRGAVWDVVCYEDQSFYTSDTARHEMRCASRGYELYVVVAERLNACMSVIDVRERGVVKTLAMYDDSQTAITPITVQPFTRQHTFPPSPVRRDAPHAADFTPSPLHQ
ncbi:hypothetical protein E2C01_042300 [Portunus trituberculatus]|uniref:Uncharacterized protein n=1 Tax=Portunus trituberculatus TaxID=210409 RepID=A0A5B7FSP8_PORTR|nr:hypothetical protein [Portunus trituberculatus]